MTLFRRSLIVGSVVLASPGAVHSQTENSFVLAITHNGCPNCRIWRAQGGDEWLETPQAKRAHFREVMLPLPRDVGNPQRWPKDVQWVGEAFLADQDRWMRNDQANVGSISTSGIYRSPRFYVIWDGKLVASAAGTNGWKYDIQPMITKLVGP
jgi:hypothetical protein